MPEMQQNSGKVGFKEEGGAGNHQIANLLLNLASRSQQGTEQAEETEAMDLTKYRKPKTNQENPASAAAAVKPAPANSLYSSMCLSSPFLLQNLLMQQINPTSTIVGQPAGIPLMAGQIVAALNSLLFTLHGLQDKGVEMNVQGQNTTTTTHFHLTERWGITMLSLQSSYLVSYTWLVRLISITLRFVES